MIDKLKERIAYMEEEGHEMDLASWGDEEGIVIAGNEAKLVVEMYEALEQISKWIDDGAWWLGCPVSGGFDESKITTLLAKARGEKQ